MPITQARMIAVLDAAQTLRSRLSDIRERAQTTSSELGEADSDPIRVRALAHSFIAMILDDPPPLDEILTLEREQIHFTLSARRNARNAKSLRKRREQNRTQDLSA